MAQNGFILLHHQILECAELAEPEALALWVHLLLRAAHKPVKVNFRKRIFQLQRGDLVTSQRVLAKMTKIKRHPLRRLLSLFADSGMIKNGPQNGPVFTHITICKYDDFQTLSTEAGPQNGQAAAQRRPTEQLKSLRLPSESESLTTESSTKYMLDESTSSDVWKEGFAKFYAAYPRKVSKDSAARAYRAALKRASLEEIMDGLRRAVLFWKRNKTDKGYIPHPATWLNGGRWADELIDAPKPNGHGDAWLNAARELLSEEQSNGEAEYDLDPFLQRARDSLLN